MVPLVVIFPILLPNFSANQRLPSGADVMPRGLLPGVGVGYSVIVPVFMTSFPTLLPSLNISVKPDIAIGPGRDINWESLRCAHRILRD